VYDRILVAVDNSPQCDRAVDAACKLANLSKGTIYVFHVRERQDVVGKGGGSFDVEYAEEAEALVKRVTETCEKAGVTTSSGIVHVPIGHIAGEIVKAAGDQRADTIVMGSHGRSAIGAAVLGSNAYKVVHLADRPVLIVR
jgi:nucleotide-binding universal stress UspA family protein